MSMPNRREALRLLAAGGLGLAGGNVLRAQAPRTAEVLIRRGRVVNADGIQNADVRIIGETIAEVGSGLRPGAGAHVIDAAGKLLLPGGIDPHTHISPGYGVDDFRTASMAALAGGITTIGTFASRERGEKTVEQALDSWSEDVKRDAIADVLLHSTAWPPTDDVIAAISRVAERGQPSFKVFLSESDTGAHIHALVRLLEAARDAGVVTMMHCEDASIVDAATRRLAAEGHVSLDYYPASRPVAAEIAATSQVASWCESIKAPLYIVHLSSARALEIAQRTRKLGAPLFVETRSLYLHVNEDRMAGPDAALYVSEPPLRTAADTFQLWRGLADERIDVLGSDHAPFTRAQKTDPGVLSITKHLAGMSDLQFMLPLYFSRGVHKEHLALTRFVATTSTNAARIFGLYPRKGVIKVGSDADIAIWDPSRQGTVTADADLSNSDYSLYAGINVRGWPVTTIRRGEVVYDGGRVAGRSGSGQLVSRKRWRLTS